MGCCQTRQPTANSHPDTRLRKGDLPVNGGTSKGIRVPCFCQHHDTVATVTARHSHSGEISSPRAVEEPKDWPRLLDQHLRCFGTLKSSIRRLSCERSRRVVPRRSVVKHRTPFNSAMRSLLRCQPPARNEPLPVTLKSTRPVKSGCCQIAPPLRREPTPGPSQVHAKFGVLI